jgi:5-methylcytosine-specific restriction endonuclease McrA
MPERPPIPATMSRAVMLEAGHRCAVCGETSALDVHHIIPWEKVKKHEPANLICLCAVCHRRAGDNEMDRSSLRQYKTHPWVKTRGARAPPDKAEPAPVGQDGSRNISIGGNASGNIIIAGDNNVVGGSGA